MHLDTWRSVGEDRIEGREWLSNARSLGLRRGFDVEKARRGTGIGLASSEERIRLLQGSFEVRST